MPTEAEPWQPVDVSDVEEKLRKLSTTPVEAKAEAPPSPPPPQEEVDFGSEPEELLLKKPLVSTSALPTSTLSVEDSTSGATASSKEASHEESKDFTSADAPPPPAKAPPAGAKATMEDMMKLRPFLRLGGDGDSDTAMAKAGFTPPPRSSSLPKSSLKPRSKSKASSRAASKEPERSQTPKRGAKSPPRQEDQEVQHKRKKTVGAISSSYFTGYTPSDVAPLPVYGYDEMPRNMHARHWKRDFLEWTFRDLKKSWPLTLEHL